MSDYKKYNPKYLGSGYSTGRPELFFLQPTNLIEEDIIYNVRLLLYNSRAGHISQVELLQKLESILHENKQNYIP